MNLFVTGATGFIGSHFVQLAHAAGHQITASRRQERPTSIPLPVDITWLNGLGLSQLEPSHLAGHDALVHFAAAGVSPQKAAWDELFSVNVTQSLQLWRHAISAGIKHIIICGSCFEYGKSGEDTAQISAATSLQPVSAYGASKAAASIAFCALIREAGVLGHLLRPFNVYGEGQHKSNFWPSLRAAALAGEDFEMSPGEQIRDFLPVTKAVQSFLNALEPGDVRLGNPRVENVGSGVAVSLRCFAESEWKKFGATGRLKVGALPYRKGEIMRYVPLIS